MSLTKTFDVCVNLSYCLVALGDSPLRDERYTDKFQYMEEL